MSLSWVRLDSNIASHDKVLKLIGRSGGHRAAAVYVFGLAWSGGHGTDGHVPKAALPMLHGRPADARLLVECGLWDADDDGWRIHNYAQRQELALVTEVKRHAQRMSAARTNCIRWHGPDCGCWQAADDPPPIAIPPVRRVK